jgi:hypothetical protein
VQPPPKWWGVEDDWDLLRGVRRHGVDPKPTLMDPSLRFHSVRVQLSEARRAREASRKAKLKAKKGGAEGRSNAEAGVSVPADPPEDGGKTTEAEARAEVDRKADEEMKTEEDLRTEEEQDADRATAEEGDAPRGEGSDRDRPPQPRAPGRELPDTLPQLFGNSQRILAWRIGYLVAASLGQLDPFEADLSKASVAHPEGAAAPEAPAAKTPDAKRRRPSHQQEGATESSDAGAGKRRPKQRGPEGGTPNAPAGSASRHHPSSASLASRTRGTPTPLLPPLDQFHQAASSSSSIPTDAPPQPSSVPEALPTEPPSLFLNEKQLSEMEAKKRRKYVRSGNYTRDRVPATQPFPSLGPLMGHPTLGYTAPFVPPPSPEYVQMLQQLYLQSMHPMHQLQLQHLQAQQMQQMWALAQGAAPPGPSPGPSASPPAPRPPQQNPTSAVPYPAFTIADMATSSSQLPTAAWEANPEAPTMDPAAFAAASLGHAPSTFPQMQQQWASFDPSAGAFGSQSSQYGSSYPPGYDPQSVQQQQYYGSLQGSEAPAPPSTDFSDALLPPAQ